ncbi:MAG: hypothetical protein AMXMBFR20_32120 [Planctomycetia bacterium]
MVARTMPHDRAVQLALFVVLILDSGAIGVERSIQGVVVDSTGKAIANATVVAANQVSGCIMYIDPGDIQFGSDQLFYSPWKKEKQRDGAGMATSDHRGRFKIGPLRQGRYVLLVIHADHGTAQLIDIESSETPKDLTVRMDPPTFIEGQIHGYTPKKSPWLLRGKEETARVESAADPNLFVRPPDCRYGPLIRHQPFSFIDRRGRFRIGPLLTGGRHTVRITWSISSRLQNTELTTMEVDIASGKTTHLDIYMDKGTDIRGRAIDESGKPLAESSVRLVKIGARDKTGAIGFGAETDDKGRFEVRGVEPGEYLLTCDRTWERSEAAQMGKACESARLEFITAEEKLVVGTSTLPEIIFKVTKSDYDRADALEEEWATERERQASSATSAPSGAQ